MIALFAPILNVLCYVLRICIRSPALHYALQHIALLLLMHACILHITGSRRVVNNCALHYCIIALLHYCVALLRGVALQLQLHITSVSIALRQRTTCGELLPYYLITLLPYYIYGRRITLPICIALPAEDV